MENAASVHNTCLDKIVRYLQRIFNRNRKQVNKLNALKFGFYAKINARYIFVCIFFQICKIQTSNFRKHIEVFTSLSGSERVVKIG